jgi:hypothetical protein
MPVWPLMAINHIPDLDKDLHTSTVLIGAVAVAAMIIGYFSIRPRLQRVAQSSFRFDASSAVRDPPSQRVREESAVTATQRTDDTKVREVRQPYDAFLVLDVEGTCTEGSSWDWPNEIIVSSLLVHSRDLTVQSPPRSGPSV